jgi:hypothetical protein
MNFDQRCNAIGEWLRTAVLPRYTRPDHLDDLAAKAEAADLVTDINAEIPVMASEAFNGFLADVHSKLRRTYTRRDWPPIAAFVKAIHACRGERPSAATSKAEPPDEYAIAAEKMRAGDLVGQQYIYGPKAKELEARGMVDDATFRKYRSAVFFALRGTYGGERAIAMEDELIRDHTACARPTSPEELAAMREAKFKRMGQ